MRTNPFHKFLKAEDHLHLQVVNYLRLQYPKVFWIHCPNEGRRTKFEQYKAKVLGITSGVPDLMLFQRKLTTGATVCGLAIELKIKPNKPTENQIKCLASLFKSGWQTDVIYDFDTAKKTIDDYLSP